MIKKKLQIKKNFFFMNEVLRSSLRLLKSSKAIVLSLRTSTEHLSDFFNKVL